VTTNPSWATRRLFRVAIVLLVGGIVLAAVASDTAGDVAGATIAGIGGVLLVSFAFLLVGESEDRDRASRR
jgi:hypothetical protein